MAVGGGQQPGFADLRGYLQANNKKLGVPEWGLVSSVGGATGDNAYFIARMYDEFAELAALGLPAYEGYYEDVGAPDTLDHRMMPGSTMRSLNSSAGTVLVWTVRVSLAGMYTADRAELLTLGLLVAWPGGPVIPSKGVGSTPGAGPFLVLVSP